MTREENKFMDNDDNYCKAHIEVAMELVQHTKERTVRSFTWEDVSCSYGPDRCVLKASSGSLKSGEVLAIMGPSGCGKSSLLDILTLRKSVGEIRGRITADGCAVTGDMLARHASYMSQDSVFLPMQTVEEVLTFQATMRLGRGVPREVVAERVASLLTETGLGGHKAKQRVGGVLPGGVTVKGLSGGEQRRLSLCCSVIQDPDVLFCDEPTSGLDSRAALRVMQQIRNYCARGVMCLTAIHQPRSAIWQGFHKVLILSKGHPLYFGPRAGAEPWFQELVHFRRDPETSVVDWLLDIVNTDFESLDEADDIKGALHNEGLSKASEAFLNSSTLLAERATWGRQATSSFLVTGHSSIPRTSGSPKAWWFQYNLLLNRAFKNALRNPSNLLTRLTCNFFVAVAAGLIFFQVARKTHSYLFDIQVLVALNMLIYGSVVTPFASISLFINDRKFFTSDNASGLYRTSAYYMAQMTVELVAAAINASLYCCVATALTGLMDLVPDPSLRLTRFFEMLGIIIFSTMVGTSIVQFFASLSPNFDVAFILCASNITFALLSGGVIVFYPTMSTVSSWMPNLSFIRYLFQALVQQMLRGTSHAAIISTLQLDTPKGVLPNLAVGAVFYVAACFGTFMCLKFLHKEKR